MPEVAFRVLVCVVCDRVEGFEEGAERIALDVRAIPKDVRFYLAESFFDGVQFLRSRRDVKQARSCRFYRTTDVFVLVVAVAEVAVSVVVHTMPHNRGQALLTAVADSGLSHSATV